MTGKVKIDTGISLATIQTLGIKIRRLNKYPLTFKAYAPCFWVFEQIRQPHNTTASAEIRHEVL